MYVIMKFNFLLLTSYAGVAQLAERLTCNQEVESSTLSTSFLNI